MAVFTGNGSQAAPSFTFSSDTDLGIYRAGGNSLGFAANNTTIMYASPLGVGIFRTAQTGEALSVGGRGTFGGNGYSSINGTEMIRDRYYTFPNSQTSWGIERGTGAAYIGSGVGQNEDASGYFSCNELTTNARTLFSIGSTIPFRLRIAPAAAAIPHGDPVTTLADVLRVTESGQLCVNTTSAGTGVRAAFFEGTGSYITPPTSNALLNTATVYAYRRYSSGEMTASKYDAAILGGARIDATTAPPSGARIFGVLGTSSNSYGGTLAVALGALGNAYISGSIGVGTFDPTSELHVAGSSIRVQTPETVTNSTDPGNQGTIKWDADYIYVCTATNVWKRASLATW